MAKLSTCPFCGDKTQNMSSEHWLPQSWRKYLALPELYIHRTSVEGVRGETTVEYRTPLDQKFGGICGSCNSHDLRLMDVAAQARTLNLTWKKTTEIPATEVAVVATAATRAALMLIWGHRETYSYPKAAYPQLRDRRLPPDGVSVFMGFSDEPSIYAAGQHSAVETDEGQPRGVHILSWGLGWLFVVVVVPNDGDPSVANRVTRRVQKVNQMFGQPLKQVWPNSRRKSVNLSTKNLLSREYALFLTQARPLLLGDVPTVMEDRPARLDKKMAEMTEVDIDRLVRQPTKALPELP